MLETNNFITIIHRCVEIKLNLSILFLTYKMITVSIAYIVYYICGLLSSIQSYFFKVLHQSLFIILIFCSHFKIPLPYFIWINLNLFAINLNYIKRIHRIAYLVFKLNSPHNVFFFFQLAKSKYIILIFFSLIQTHYNSSMSM